MREAKALDPLGALAAGEAAARAHLLSDLVVADAVAATALREAQQRAARDSERDVRALGHLTRAVRDLTAVARAEQAREAAEREAERQRRDAAAAQERRTEELRRDLARRLDAMVASERERERDADEAAEQASATADLEPMPSEQPQVRPLRRGPRTRGPRVRGFD